MQRLITTLLILLFQIGSPAQQSFIKATTDFNYGASLRIIPAGAGWVIFSQDSLKLTKFDNCGMIAWSKHYNIPNTHSNLKDFITTTDRGFVILTRESVGSQYKTLITKLDSAGAILWSKRYDDAFYDEYPYSIFEDNQGNLFLYANMGHVTVNGYNMLCKMKANGNILWIRFYDHGGTWGEAIHTDDNGVLMRTGNTFIKTDNAGNVQWTSYFYTGDQNYYQAVEVSDGYIFPLINSGSSYISFYKINKQGGMMWTARKTLDVEGVAPRFSKKSNGNIAAVFNKFYSGTSYITTAEFDKHLNIITQSSIDAGVNLRAHDLCFLNDGTPVIAASLAGTQLFFARLDNDYHTKCDINLPLITITTDPVTQAFDNTNVSTYTLSEANKNYTVDSLPVNVISFCNVPKILDLGDDTILCKGAAIILKNQSGDLFDHYSWSTGESTASITINKPGTYWLFANDDCETNRSNDTIWITIVPAVEPNLGEDLFLCENTSHVIKAPLCDSCIFTWSTGSHTDSIQINTSGAYWLTVKNNNGCVATDTVEVKMVKCGCHFYLPNAFTPDGDGLNETFNPVYDCDVAAYNLKIFNRWGQLIYNTDHIQAGWNGEFDNRNVSEGVYLYVINYTPVIKGKETDRVTKSGTVAVIY